MRRFHILAIVKNTAIPLKLHFSCLTKYPEMELLNPTIALISVLKESQEWLLSTNRTTPTQMHGGHKKSIQKNESTIYESSEKMQTMCLMKFWQSKYLRNFCDLVGKKKIFTATTTFAKSEQMPQVDFSPMRRSRWSTGTWEYTQSQQSGKHDSDPLSCSLTPVAGAFTNAKGNMSGWKDVQLLRALAAFSEDLGSVPSTCVRRCTAACNSDVSD